MHGFCAKPRLEPLLAGLTPAELVEAGRDKLSRRKSCDLYSATLDWARRLTTRTLHRPSGAGDGLKVIFN